MSKEKQIKDDEIIRSFAQNFVRSMAPLSYLVHASVDHEIKRAYEQRREKLRELKRSRRRGSKELKRLTDEINSLLEVANLGERVNTVGKGEESNLDTTMRIDEKYDSFAEKDKIIEDLERVTIASTDEITRSLPFQDSEFVYNDETLYKSLLSDKSSTVTTLSIDQIKERIERRKQRRLELLRLTTLGKRGVPCLSLDTSNTNKTFSIEEIRKRIERRRQRRLELQSKIQSLTKSFVELGKQY